MDVKLTNYHNLLPKLTMCGDTVPQPAAEGVMINKLHGLVYLKIEKDSRFLFDNVDTCIPNYTVAQSRSL
jgi:hypothetical protein